MVVATYVGPADERKYAQKKLRDAREVIRQFPLLKSISGNFKPLAHRLVRNNQNSLFLIAASSSPKNPLLVDAESALRHFRYKSWKEAAKADFARRLVSPREDNSWSCFCEMNVALRLEQRYGRKNVTLYPSIPGPDTAAKIHDRQISFEVTSIFPGKTEDRLTQICRGIAKGLYLRIKGKRSLQIEIQTSKLPKDGKDRFQIRPSINKVLKSFDELGIATILPKFGSFSLQQAADYLSTTTAFKAVPQLRNPYLKGLEKGFRTKAFKTFSRSATHDALSGSPIIYFISGKARTHRIVSVHCQQISPSKPAQDEQRAFLERLEKRLQSKLNNRKQIVPGRPNVLVVNARNWTIYGFDYSPSMYDWQIEFEPVRRSLRNALAGLHSPNLSAIMIYENDFGNARIIENRFAKRESRLTVCEGISLLTKRRVAQYKKIKEAARMRKRIIPSKLKLVEHSVVTGYEAASEIKSLASCRPFDSSTDGTLSLVPIPDVFTAPKAWFRDPQFSGQFVDAGHILATREEAYLVKRIGEDCEHVILPDFSYEALSEVIERFSSEVGPPSVIFVPLSLNIDLHNWLGQRHTHRIMRWETGKEFLISKSGLEVPIKWLTQSHPDKHAIVYSKKVHGEWIIKPGNLTKDLSLKIETHDKDDVRVVAKSTVAYKTLDRRGAWRLSIQGQTLTSAD